MELNGELRSDLIWDSITLRNTTQQRKAASFMTLMRWENSLVWTLICIGLMLSLGQPVRELAFVGGETIAGTGMCVGLNFTGMRETTLSTGTTIMSSTSRKYFKKIRNR